MDRQLLRKYISEYERKFAFIDKEEIYKWRAVKQFQDNWNPDAEDFSEMLSLSLSKTANLMDAGYYWPKRMIRKIAENRPQLVRRMFINLFDEELDVLERIEVFQEKINNLNTQLFPGKNSYQDDRAAVVYLSLKFPEIYYFYKFEMFKDFCKKMNTDFIPKRGKKSNVLQYFEMCTEIRGEIRSNNNLLKLHKKRIGDLEYFDIELNILTQDFIYATTNYLNLDKEHMPALASRLTLNQISFKASRKKYQFVGRYVDYVAKEKRNKVIGDAGEEIVLQYEKEHCPPKYRSQVAPKAKQEGDGLGYDILSFDSNGNEKYIEVKTTSGSADRPFFISRIELERSKKEGAQYYLYRLYNFDAKKRTADFFVLRGDLSEYCINPTEFEVIPTE